MTSRSIGGHSSSLNDRRKLEERSGTPPAGKIKFIKDSELQSLPELVTERLYGTIHAGELNEILGRRIETDPDGRPLLSAKERRTIETALEVRRAIYENPKLDDAAKQRVLDGIRAVSENQKTMNADRLIEKARGVVKGEEAAVELTQWANGDLKLEQPGGTVFHKAREAWSAGAICVPFFGDRPTADDMSPFDVEHHTFLIEHDWAAAFQGATDFDGGETRLPFEYCSLEYRISGHSVIALIHQGPMFTNCILMARTKSDVWVLPWLYSYDHGRMIPTQHRQDAAQLLTDPLLIAFQRVADLIGKSIRAVSISLDAKVAETTVVRADYKLNAARAKRGKLPIYDYHVVSLARRTRAPALPRDPNAEPGTQKRLHFRRGHWRHYDNHKTWINWMLVGNPDLGFIDKHYRL